MISSLLFREMCVSSDSVNRMLSTLFNEKIDSQIKRERFILVYRIQLFIMRLTLISVVVVLCAATTSAFTTSIKTSTIKKTQPRTNGVVPLNSIPIGTDMISTLLSLEISQAQQPLIAGAVALLGLIGVVVSNNSGSDSTSPTAASPKASTTAAAPEPKVDVSIPYNAAAMLEYTKLIGKFDATMYAKFEPLYLEKVVAQVTAKKVERDSKLEIEKLNAIATKVDADIAALVSK